MKRLRITFNLVDDLVFSERAATLGGHGSLDYIPGAAILGWCASKLYSTLSKSKSYQMFHSGHVRFNNAYPVHSETGEVAAPIPFSLHEQKSIQGGPILNYLNNRFEQGIQARQLRRGYIVKGDHGGRFDVIQPLMTMRMKTAIDSLKARAATGQLFGYQAIEGGQVFQSEIEIDDDLADITDPLMNCLKGEILIGRSRSAQYGRVSTTVTEVNEAPATPVADGEDIRLLLMSDLALDTLSTYPLHPNQISFYPNTEIDWGRSFIRYRQYSPYNGYRRCYDLERHVMCQGSVVYLKVKGGDAQGAAHCLQQGLGLHREAGLGVVSVNPEILTSNEVSLVKAACRQVSIKAEGDPNQHELVQWLNKRQKGVKGHQNDTKLADAAVAQLSMLYQHARNYLGAQEGTLVGPSGSQWGRVKDAAARYKRDPSKLIDALFGNDSPICDGGDSGWDVVTFIGDNGPRSTFSAWFKGVLENQSITDPSNVATIIARNAYKVAQKQERREAS